MLANAVPLGLLLTKKLVEYAVKCCAPRFITGRQLCMLSNAVPLELLL